MPHRAASAAATARTALSDLVARARAAGAAAERARQVAPARPLEPVAFAPNPGALRAFAHVPPGLPRGAPLVVAIHGCTQTAASYDRGTGWSDLAGRMGFALLLPEQDRSNNGSLCMNWFEPGDTARDRGEAASIRAMVAAMVERHGLDPRRVFVTGLSAGGAMTAALLAAYPDVFAAGAVVAGLPAGAAHDVPTAFEAMRGDRGRAPRAWGDLARAAAPRGYRGPWPRLLVWHGDADRTVAVSNAAALAAQWADLHGLPHAATETRTAGRVTSGTWRGPRGEALVETHIVAGMGHGVPLAPGEGAGRVGEAGPYMLDVGASSAHAIAASWGLGPERARAAAATERPAPTAEAAPREAMPPRPRVVLVDDTGGARLADAPGPTAGARPTLGTTPPPPPPVEDGGRGPGAIIREALAAAGLLPRR